MLTDVVGSFRGPGVVAIDAAWGTGKTTFLRMWSQELTNHNFTVVEFNAWDTDFAADPFLALSTEIQKGLESTGTDVPRDAMQKVKKWSVEILRHGVPELIRLSAATVPILPSFPSGSRNTSSPGSVSRVCPPTRRPRVPSGSSATGCQGLQRQYPDPPTANHSS